MLINEKKDFQINEHELLLEGVLYINYSQWLPAYSIFKQLTQGVKSPSVVTLYNMALCCFYAKEYMQSISLLNDAINGMVGTGGSSKYARSIAIP
jgi:hypothetical protein